MKVLAKASAATVLSVFLLVFVMVCVLELLDSHLDAGFQGVFIAFSIAVVAAFVALLITLGWAIPLHWLLRRYQWTGLGWYLLLALLPSVAFVYGIKPFGDDSAADLFNQALLCCGCGMVGASVFWYHAVYRQTVVPAKRDSEAC